MKVLFTLLYCVAFYQSLAQITIKDFTNNEPIPYVELLNSSGRIIGLTNEKGIVNSELIKNIENNISKYIRLHNLSYTDILIDKEIFLNQREIYLYRKIRQLEEVTIKPKIKTYYLQLRGYYRTYSIIDSNIKNYADGEIIFLFPKNSGKNVLNYRVQERSYIPVKEKKIGEFNINIVGPRVPDMNLMNTNRNKETFEYLDELAQNYFLNGQRDKINTQAAYSANGNKLIVYNAAFTSPNKPVNLTRGSRQSIMNYHNEFTVFNTSQQSEVSLENISYHKEIRKYKMKRKEDKAFQDIEDIGEFFVYDATYVKKPDKCFKLFTGFNNESNYTTEYWKTAEKHAFYQPLPSGIADSSKNNLILLPNKHNK